MHLQHAAGSGGPGAVFGSKRLKAVAVRGTAAITVASPAAEYIAACKELHDIIMENPVRPAFRWAGTTGHAARRQRGRRSAVPEPPGRPGSRTWPHPQRRDRQVRHSATRPAAAATSSAARSWSSSGRAAPTAPSASSTSPSGRSAPTAASSICRRSWRPTLCDRLGIDTMSAGGAISWAMEMTQRGCCSRGRHRRSRFQLRQRRRASRGRHRRSAAREGFGDRPRPRLARRRPALGQGRGVRHAGQGSRARRPTRRARSPAWV